MKMLVCWIGAIALGALSACTQKPAGTLAASSPSAATVAATHTPAADKSTAGASIEFTPPTEAQIPDGPLGDVIRQGRDIFIDTPQHATAYVGNGLSCSNCHLD
ncbi:MAG TPA: hypothetical protein VGV14_15545, partial [Rhodanobacter sp.]|nr:hypothetical protein [Rhodanobacter sp.]